jgi:carbon-monoxide dehydrogenase small subunit
MSGKKELKFTVNGQPYDVFVSPKTLLVEVIREQLGLTGTKRACNSSSCGACTVIMDGVSVKSCSVLALQANGREIMTVEGLAKDGKYDPIQKAFLDHGAYQCGFCTPGMLMSSKALFMQNPKPTKMEIKEALDGNLCRCTGYNSIIRALMDVAKGEYKEDKVG